MPKRTFLNLLKGYEPSGKDGKGKRFVSKEISGTASRDVASRTGRRMAAVAQGFFNMIAYTSTRSCGLFLGSFGLLTLLIHIAKDYLGFSNEVSLPIIITASLFAILSIPFITFDKPMAIAMQELRLTEVIFFEFFCMQRLQKKSVPITVHPVAALILGVLLATLGGFVPVFYVILGILAAVYLYLAVASPEFSFFFIFLVMPYLPMLEYAELILAVLVLITLLSFVRKIAEGKRIYHLEQYDVLIWIMLTMVFISGILIGDSSAILSALVMLLLGFGGYALTGSLVANRRLADCVVKANIFSSLPISVIAIIEFSLGLARGEVRGSSATLGSPDMLGAFLLVSAFFMAYFVRVRRSVGVKVIYGIYLLLTAVAMATTLRVWLAATVIIALLAVAVISVGRFASPLLAALALLPYGFLFLPDSALSAIMRSKAIAVLGLDSYIWEWMQSRELFLDNLFLGVGTGNFADTYYSANFLLQIACEAGLLVLVAFVAIFAVRLVHRSVYRPYMKSSQVGLASNLADVVLVSLLVYGLFTSLWVSPTIYYLFWCVFGFGSAVLRISKKEFDDRVGYFSDGASSDSSSIDISLL